MFRHRAGHCPFLKWLTALNQQTQQRVSARVDRLKKGQFGDYKMVDRHLYELRLFFGPGYRIYFAERRGTTILILAGGDKSSQSRDIKEAKAFWKIYQADNP
jgi:putative addiction module killer protein